MEQNTKTANRPEKAPPLAVDEERAGAERQRSGRAVTSRFEAHELLGADVREIE